MESKELKLNDKINIIINQINNISKSRWFLPEEIEYILQNNTWKHLGFRLNRIPPKIPQDGEIYFYDKKLTPKYKNDEIIWSKRKSNEKAQESYHKFKINNVERIAAIYCRAMHNKNFCRRIYKLIDKIESNIIIVHYRESLLLDDAIATPVIKSFVTQWKSLDVTFDHEFVGFTTPIEYNINDDTMSIDSEILDELKYWSEQSPLRIESNDNINNNNISGISNPLLINILDFAPTKDHCKGKSKIIIVLDKPINISNVQVRFGNITVYGELISSNVIRCYTPAMISPNKCKIALFDTFGNPISYQSFEDFEFMSNTVDSNPLYSKQDQTARINNKTGNIDSSINNINNEREHKIRIVEKLGKTILSTSTNTVNHASIITPHLPISNDTLVESNSQHDSNNYTENSIDTIDNHLKWLTDAELSSLSLTELEKVMDTYISSIVKQLVHIASFDDDLKTEINSLDSCGYSLLHYCCLYNLNNLVTILLNKGVDINLKSSNHSMTALHIATSHGYLDLVRLLVDNKADVNVVDDYGNFAYDIAVAKGYIDLANYLRNYMKQSITNENSVKSNNQIIDESTMIHSNNLPTNTMLLQEAFSSLSLVDKCALSLSIGSLSNNSSNSTTTTTISPRSSRSRTSILELSNNESDLLNTSSNTDVDFDMQSVISECDKESLDVAMSMMGQHELDILNYEVKIIQSSVRTWLLRKNYINLRESARVLQGFWREKRKINILHQSNNKKNSFLHISTPIQNHNRDYNDRQLHAVETLQAATRGMIARKSFNNIRRQTMASLTIQKVLYMNHDSR